MTGALDLCLKNKLYWEGAGQMAQFTELMQFFFFFLLGFHKESYIWLSQCISGYNPIAH